VFSTSNIHSVLLLIFYCVIMTEKILSKKAKKLVRWHSNYVVFITPEAKKAGWDDKTIVKVSLVDVDGEKKIVIERGMQL